ncbi:MAG: hypothetical protein FXF47_07425 [Candidatus Mcinerneyibacterium aminivorans]|uniref:Uncharacterized protein n=1 Tax=Candidatus Mcinerneyibacterium aminivorans TaxID=2703815 RepID=A0A5D0MEH0_9BACT|nr:MAG: hypothetical protein FXF47_07425 [Candidatus Mcinerneyibacterium aminivorans]
MKAKYKISSTKKSKHGKKITKKVLEKQAEKINNSEDAIPFILDNNYNIPPIGKMVSAELVEDGEEDYTLEVMIEFYDGEKRIENREEDLYRLVNKNDKRPYIRMFENEDNNIFTVYYDYSSFSETDLKEIMDKSKQIGNARIYGNKSVIPAPVTIFSIGSLKHLGYKIEGASFEKLHGDISEELLEGIKKLIPEIIKKVNSDNEKPAFMFKTDDNIQLEFVIQLDDYTQIENSLKNIQNCIDKAEDYLKDYDIDTIQFRIDESHPEWYFNYLIDTDGEIVCKKETLKKITGMMREVGRKKSR